MTATTWVALALATHIGLGFAWCLLLFSGVTHLLNLRRFRAVVHAQGLLPIGWVRAASGGFAATEALTGMLGLLGQLPVATGHRQFVVLSGIPAAVCYSVMTAYVAKLVWAGSEAPCGCLGSSRPLGRSTLGRLCLLTLLTGCYPFLAVAVPGFSVLALGTAVGMSVALATLAVSILRREGMVR